MLTVLSQSYLFLSLLTVLVSGDPLSYTECDVEHNVGKLELLIIPGDPVEVGQSHPVDLTIKGNINAAIGDDVDLSLKIEKEVSIFGIKKWISVPCIDGYGSCTRKLADYFNNYNQTFACNLLTAMGKPCSMPFEAGSYAVDHFIIPVNLSKVPAALLSMASGNLRVHLQLANDAPLYCIDVSVGLEFEVNSIVDHAGEQPIDQPDDSAQYGGWWADYNPFSS